MRKRPLWTCPRCVGHFAIALDHWECLECGATYRALRGIPDLRTSDDLYLSNEADWELASRLDEDFDRLEFRAFLDRYYELQPDLSAEQKRRQIDHILSAPGRVAGWLRALGAHRETGPVLDLGCGSGSFLAAIGRSVDVACGVDIAMRWLLVARKRLDEEGLGQIPLICACAEDLPIESSRFESVVAGDVIEHVGDQAATINEAHRVLRGGGRLFMASPNRYSLGLEPHVGIWGVGFLPRSWMPGYVRRTSGRDFRAIRTLGYFEWRKLLRATDFGGGRMIVPKLPAHEIAGFTPIKRVIARAYNAVVTTLPGQWLARAVGPLFHVVCQRASSRAPHSPTRATRLRSRPSATRK